MSGPGAGCPGGPGLAVFETRGRSAIDQLASVLEEERIVKVLRMWTHYE